MLPYFSFYLYSFRFNGYMSNRLLCKKKKHFKKMWGKMNASFFLDLLQVKQSKNGASESSLFKISLNTLTFVIKPHLFTSL